MTPEEIKRRLETGPEWYHTIELCTGVSTPGLQSLVEQWQMMRQVRRGIDYAGKSVLDLASYNGMWAFEAEMLGAEFVVAADCIHLPSFENFLFARECLKSKVVPMFNVPMHDVFRRLDVIFDERRKLFDVVHHLGVFYHLRDPMVSLAEARSCLVDGGKLFFETAIVNAEIGGMVYNGMEPARRLYCDHTTWFAPSVKAMKEMLKMTLFNVDESSVRIMKQTETLSRMCLIATARPIDPNSQDDRELSRQSRNMGLHLEKMWLELP